MAPITPPTDRRIREAHPDEDDPKRAYTIGDPTTPGFGIRIFGIGRKTFQLRYRTKNRKQRPYKVGEYPALSLKAAREIARSLYADVAAGKDP